MVIGALGDSAGITGTRIAQRDASRKWVQIYSEPPRPFGMALELADAMVVLTSLAEMHARHAEITAKLESDLSISLVSDDQALVTLAHIQEQREASEETLARLKGNPPPAPETD